jgi:hypothetical protein
LSPTRTSVIVNSPSPPLWMPPAWAHATFVATVLSVIVILLRRPTALTLPLL